MIFTLNMLSFYSFETPKHFEMTSPKVFIISSILLFFNTACQCARPSQEKGASPAKTWQQWCPGAKDLPVFFSESDKQFAIKAMREISAEMPQAHTPEIVIALSGRFLGTPYLAHTLEVREPEKLVIDLAGMDCTTFVEQMLAMALAVKQGDSSFEDFVQVLACIRYRGGIIDGFPSRLHYFTDWLQDNTRKDILEIVSNGIGTEVFDTRVWFMTANPGAYRQLQNPAFIEKMKEVEKNIAAYNMKFIPKAKIKEVENLIKNGDIIAFTTDIGGLDVSHTGFAIFENGRLHLLHASLRTNRVEITPVTLSEYLAPMRRVTGILVARVN